MTIEPLSAIQATTLSLPGDQNELVDAVASAATKTVVIVNAATPILMPWLDKVDAVLWAGIPGQEGGHAVAATLFGDVEPAGRLAETFPVRREDVAADPFFPGQPHQVEYREGLMVGYRHHTTAGIAPLFPFGHGLGYSTFELGEPTAPRKYFVVTMLVALMLHSAGNSTPRCSKLIEPSRQLVMTTSRRSHVTSS